MKGDDLAVRPIFHWRADRVRAHLFVCFLAAYLRWHLEAAWAPLLFRDETPPARVDPVAPRPRSAGARAKERDHARPTGCRSAASRTLLEQLATLTRNRVIPAGARPAGRVRASGRAHPAPGPRLRAARLHPRLRVARAPQPLGRSDSNAPIVRWKFGLVGRGRAANRAPISSPWRRAEARHRVTVMRWKLDRSLRRIATSTSHHPGRAASWAVDQKPRRDHDRPGLREPQTPCSAAIGPRHDAATRRIVDPLRFPRWWVGRPPVAPVYR